MIGPFEAGKHVDHGPAVIFLSHDLVGRDMYVIKINFVVDVGAIHVGDTFDGNALGFHIAEHESEVLMLLGIGIGPVYTESPVRPVGAGIPGLLTVDNILIALA